MKAHAAGYRMVLLQGAMMVMSGVVVNAMVADMVPLGGKRRRRENHDQEGSSKNFLHGLNRSTGSSRASFAPDRSASKQQTEAPMERGAESRRRTANLGVFQKWLRNGEKYVPQRLKPHKSRARYGTAKAVPFQSGF